MPGFEIVGEEAMFAQQEPRLLEWVELRGVQCAEDIQMDQVRRNRRCQQRPHAPQVVGNNMRSLIREEHCESCFQEN